MKETQNNCQSPSVWGSMQDLTSWSFNDHENGEESAQIYTGGSCQWSQGSWDQSPKKQLVTHYAVKDWNPVAPARSCACAQESTCTGPSEVCQWTSEWFRVKLGESVVVRWNQNPALWPQLNSPPLEEEECWKWKWRDIRPSMVTHTRNLCSAFNPSIVHTHRSEHTHTVNTHPEQWAAIFMLRRPGSSWGFGALLKGTSVVVLRVETFTPPTYNSCRTEIWTHNLWVTSPTL